MPETAIMRKPKHRTFRETLKNTVAGIGTGLAIALASYAPLEARAQGNPTNNPAAAGVDTMAPKTKVAGAEKQDEVLARFNELAQRVSGWQFLSAEMQANQVQTWTRNKAALKTASENYVLGRIVQKILIGDSYRQEADSLRITITPATEKAIKAKFADSESHLERYLVAVKTAEGMAGESRGIRSVTPIPTGQAGLAQRGVTFPESQLFHIYENTWRTVMTTGVPAPGRDLISNFLTPVDPNATEAQRTAAMNAAKDWAGKFANGAMEVLQYATQYDWNKDQMGKNSGAASAMTNLANVLDHVTRPELKTDAAFQKMLTGLRGGDPSGFRSFISSKSDLGIAMVGYLSNLVTIDIQPMAVNVYTAKGRVVWKFPGVETPSGLKGGMAEFQEVVQGKRTSFSATFLGFFVDATYSIQDIVAVTRRLKDVGTGNPQVVVDRLSGRGMSASGAVGAIAGMGIAGQPFVITAQLAEIGYEKMSLNLKEPLQMKPGEAPTTTLEQGRAYFGVTSIDLWWYGKNESVVRLIAPHIGVKHYGGINSRNYLFYAQGGFGIERGKNSFRFDVAPKVFWLGETVRNMTDKALTEQARTAMSVGGTASLQYVRDRIRGGKGGSFGVGAVVDYNYTDYEGAKRHVVSVTLPIEWVRDIGNRKKLSIGITPGVILIDEGTISRKIPSVIGQIGFEF